MPLFNFTANDYGENWFVSASTKENAISSVRRAIHAEWQRQMKFAEDDEKKYGGVSSIRERETGWRDEKLVFLQACIDNKPSYGGGTHCSIKEIEDGEVVFAEVA